MVELTNTTMEGLKVKKNNNKTTVTIKNPKQNPVKNKKPDPQGSEFCFISFQKCPPTRKDCFQKLNTCLEKPGNTQVKIDKNERLKLKNAGKNLLDKGKNIGKDLLDKGKNIGKDLLDKGKNIGKDLFDKGKPVGKDLFNKAKSNGKKNPFK
jgi:hypothetical protein